MNLPLPAVLTITAFIAVALIAVPLIVISIRREKRLIADGIEVDAVVIRVKSRREDGHTRYYPTIRYTSVDGITHEASINVRTNFPVGRRLRVKYLPPKYDYVAFVSQEIEPSYREPCDL